MGDIDISVSDPSRCTEGFANSYISYKVYSKTVRHGFESGSHSVVRRFSDFEWLCQELAREFPGVIVPPLPEKVAVGRFGEDFIESRRRLLEKLLHRIASHSELSSSQYFIVFLQSSESGLNEAKNEAKNKAKSGSAIQWLEGTVNKVTVGTKPELEKSAADIKTEEIAQYVSQLEKQLLSASKHAENLVKRSRETAIAFFEFGQSFSFMGRSEGDTVGSALSQLGSTADGLAGSVHTFAEAEVIKLVEPLEEYYRMLQCIKVAMQQRTTKKNAYINAMIDVEAKTTAYRKVQGVPGKETQAEQKEQAVIAAQDSADAAKIDFEKVSERLLTEFELFKNQKAFDIKEIMTNFVNLQIEFNRQSEEAWAKLIPSIENVMVQDPCEVRAGAKGQSATDSATPPLNYTIGRAGRTADVPISNSYTVPASAPPQPQQAWGQPERSVQVAAATPYDDEEEDDTPVAERGYPAPPSFPPPATPPNPFVQQGTPQSTARKSKNSTFTDEEGEGGDEGEDENAGIEEV